MRVNKELPQDPDFRDFFTIHARSRFPPLGVLGRLKTTGLIMPYVDYTSIKKLIKKKICDSRAMPSHLDLTPSAEKTSSHVEEVFKHTLLEDASPSFCLIWI